ncbi:CHAD domain-containing protein [Streptomyces sp. NPDC058045]|uniref:CYTH and CHAD domain-containing protein n=1 Tax=Streptomyces sp. NPDC058045 TaxID=3346311 RepID=UPI0036ED105D
MGRAQREVERKFERTGAGDPVPPALTDVRGITATAPGGHHLLDAVYWDTADRRLAAHHITLRRRTGGPDEGWHLKLPVPDLPDTRDEIHEPLEAGTAPSPSGGGLSPSGGGLSPSGASSSGASGGGPGASGTAASVVVGHPPPALARLLRSRTRDAPLVPLVRLRTERHTTLLLGKNGEPRAELALDRVHAERLTPDGIPIGAHSDWTEAEVELAAGARPALLDRLAGALRTAGWHPSAVSSKLARALQATDPAPPESAPASSKSDSAPPQPPPDTAGEYVLHYLRAQREALISLDPAVRRDLPDAVHRMRVATRRMRSALRSYRKLLDPARTRPLIAELTWLASELGVGRDQEVLTARLTAALDALPATQRTGPVRTRLRTWSAAHRSGSRRRLRRALDGERYLRLLTTLDELTARPPLLPAATRPAAGPLTSAVSRDRRRLARRLDEAQRLPPGPDRDAGLHEARKAAKRLRYAAEAATPALGTAARDTAAAARRLQTALGEHQDSVMARTALREIADQAHAAGESSFTYGVLYAREEQHAARTEDQLPSLPPDLPRPPR